MTEWRPISGFDGYEVGSDGTVRRALRGKRAGRYRILNGYTYPHGYRMVYLCSKGHREAVLVHRLVATVFLGPAPTPQHEVAHWDGRRDNNAVENLRWATPKENAADRRRHGNDCIGEKHGAAKLTDSKILDVFRLASAGEKQRDIGARYGISQRQVYRILHRMSWSHVQVPEHLLYRPLGCELYRKDRGL